ncbi:hypothetical protein Ahy_B07g086855 [Arachis hypogaea]|uniref:Uncharacterized protein n=1 Tax=Arachis hypogaea TaxID=3818 RepID=A0A444YAT0_ARAHY|nr:hypothetical protein Ahy_B07g086855 [Arachis hypogaea]
MQRADCPISPPSGSSAPASSSLRPFRPPHSEPLPAPQACMNDVQNSDPEVEDLDPEADEVKLSVKEAMKPPNRRKIVPRFNSALQLVGDEAGLLSSVMGLLGSDYTKFPICERDWRKVRTKDKVYNECVKEMFHFEEDSRGIIKRIIFKMLGRAWKETRNILYHHCYDSELSLEENIENRPDGITAEHWRWFLDYRNSEETQEKCKKNAENRSKQLYTHTSGSKSLARLGEEEERIEAIEQRDESSKLLSQNDSLAQALKNEHLSRLCGMGLGPTSSQVFGMNSHQPSNGFEREESQRVLLKLQAELAAKKLKRKAVEDEVAVEKTKRQAVEDEVAVEKTKR